MDDTTSPTSPTRDFPSLEPFVYVADRPRVVLGVVTSGLIQAETVVSLIAASASNEIDATVVIIPNGPYMDWGRNKMMAAWWMNPELSSAERLIFVDSDIQFTVADILAIAHSPHHIVGGAYASPHDGKQYVVAYNYADGHNGPYTLTDLTVEDLDAMPGPTPVDAIGTGFLGISREAAARFLSVYHLPQPWFAEVTIPRVPSHLSASSTPTETEQLTGIQLGEDITFCLRAHAINIPVMIDPTVRLTHYKTAGIRMFPHPSVVASTD